MGEATSLEERMQIGTPAGASDEEIATLPTELIELRLSWQRA